MIELLFIIMFAPWLIPIIIGMMVGMSIYYIIFGIGAIAYELATMKSFPRTLPLPPKAPSAPYYDAWGREPFDPTY